MELTLDSAARVLLVIMAVIFIIAHRRRKSLFTVKNAPVEQRDALVDGYISSDIRYRTLQMVGAGVLGSLSLAYLIFSIVKA